MSSPLTPELIAEIAKVFNITPRELLSVRDGSVVWDDKVWWRSDNGPLRVAVDEHTDNIRANPDRYSIRKPTVRVQYLD